MIARTVLAIAVVLVGAAPLAAQQARPARVAIDTSAAVDESVDETGSFSTGVILDAVMSVDIGGGLEGIVRPFAQRLASGEWNRQVWVAALRYERSGPVSVRIDGGLIPPPVGLANLMLWPHLNPVIAQPQSLFTALPPIVPGAPRSTLLGAVYPYGVHATLSGSHWDARAAVIDTSPLRTRRVFADVNPPRFANVVLGGGITPFVGVRVGASITRGGWLRAGESPAITSDGQATVVTVETDVQFRFTRVLAEWVRDAVEVNATDESASGWFVQGQQTLTPRWYAAGRVERMSAPALTSLGTFERRQFTGTEEAVGFRVTPEITIRGAHRARRGFGRPGYDHQAAVSIVWWRRWM